MMQGLWMWTVYWNPSDYPDCYVVRRSVVGPGVIETDPEPAAVTLSLEEARAAVPKGLVRLERHPGDDSVILEVWL